MKCRGLLFIASLSLGFAGFSQTEQLVGNTTVYIDTLNSDVNVPWEIKIEGDDYLWVTERGGLVSRIDLETGVKTVVLDLTGTVHAVGESGVLGLVLHPDFPTTPEVFLVYTYGTEDGGGYFKERMVKYSFNGTNLVSPTILIDNILAWQNHNGSRLHVLPDNTLLMSTGECYQSNLAQDENSLNGKYLRINMDGSIPADNPAPDSYVYTLGHRNSQGICVLPNGKIIISEHGPTTDDELQVLEPGLNYGWPLIHGFCDENFENAPCATGMYTEPIHAWTPTIATSDLVYYQNAAFPEWDNRLLMTTLNGQRLVAMQLDANTTEVTDEDQYFLNQFGRLRDIAIGPNKEIYIATNTGDQSIIRITPPSDLGIGDLSGNVFIVVPNPAENSIQLEMKTPAEKVVVKDVNGNVIMEVKQFEKGQRIDISKLSSGAYSVEVNTTGNEIARQRFVKL